MIIKAACALFHEHELAIPEVVYVDVLGVMRKVERQARIAARDAQQSRLDLNGRERIRIFMA